MPKKEKKSESSESQDESLLVTAAKKVGKVAGKVAAVSGLAAHPEPEPRRPTQHREKLAPKNKARLPRKQKKAQKKAQKAANLAG